MIRKGIGETIKKELENNQWRNWTLPFSGIGEWKSRNIGFDKCNKEFNTSIRILGISDSNEKVSRFQMDTSEFESIFIKMRPGKAARAHALLN